MVVNGSMHVWMSSGHKIGMCACSTFESINSIVWLSAGDSGEGGGGPEPLKGSLLKWCPLNI